MDVLSDVLALARVDAALLATFDVRAPWGIELPTRRGASFHAVVAGTCWFVAHLPDGPGTPAQLTAGDLALLPTGIGHELSSGPPGPLRPPLRRFDEDLKRSLIRPDGELVVDGPGVRTRVLCAGYACGRSWTCWPSRHAAVRPPGPAPPPSACSTCCSSTWCAPGSTATARTTPPWQPLPRSRPG